MSLFSDNIKYLRTSRKCSQQYVADALTIPRPRFAKYEDGKNFPPPETLLAISRYFAMSIDLLLSVDVRKIPSGDLLKLENNRLLLPITVDENGNNMIEIVTHKAKAGYAAGGYADFTFISELDHIHLPWLNKNEKYRTFPIDGDSMPPHNDKSYIVGKYVEKLGDVIAGKTYVIVTKNQEMVYKRLNKKDTVTFILNSDNAFYRPYEIKFSDIAEIWEYAGSLERENFTPEQSGSNTLESAIKKLQQDVSEIRHKLM